MDLFPARCGCATANTTPYKNIQVAYPGAVGPTPLFARGKGGGSSEDDEQQHRMGPPVATEKWSPQGLQFGSLHQMHLMTDARHMLGFIACSRIGDEDGGTSTILLHVIEKKFRSAWTCRTRQYLLANLEVIHFDLGTPSIDIALPSSRCNQDRNIGLFFERKMEERNIPKP